MSLKLKRKKHIYLKAFNFGASFDHLKTTFTPRSIPALFDFIHDFLFMKNNTLSIVKSKEHKYFITVNPVTLFFKVIKTNSELIYSSDKEIDLNSGLIVNITSL